MMCPKCRSNNKIKNGKVNGRQRYKCKECGYNYTVVLKSTAKSEMTKRFALTLYLEGPGFRSIGRLLKVSHVAVMNWVKNYGKNLEKIRNKAPVEIV